MLSDDTHYFDHKLVSKQTVLMYSMYTALREKKIRPCAQKCAELAVNQQNDVYILLLAVVTIQHISVRATCSF